MIPLSLRRAIPLFLAWALSACGQDTTFEFTALPQGDFILAFLLTVDSLGRAVDVSAEIRVEDGVITWGPPRFEVTPRDDEQVYFIGLQAEHIADVNPMLDLDSLSKTALSRESEACTEGALHAEDDTLQIPLGPYAETLRLDESLSFTEVAPADVPPALSALSARLPLRPMGCDPGMPTELVPFFADPGYEAQSTFGGWVDGDRIVVGSPVQVGLYVRSSTTPVALFMRPPNTPRFSGIAIDRHADGTATIAVQTSEELEEGGPPSGVLYLEADANDLSLVGTSTRVAEQITSIAFDHEGGLLATALEGVVFYGSSIDAEWSADRSFLGNALSIARATGTAARPHVVASTNGQVFIGDFSQRQLLEQTSPVNKLEDLTTVEQSDGVHMWLSSKDVSLQPPEMHRRSGSSDWEKLTILVPTAGDVCSEPIECGQRRLLKSLTRLAITEEGEGRYRVFGSASTCTAIVSYRPEDLCPTLFTLPGIGVQAPNVRTFLFVEAWQDRLLVSVHGGGLYELDR